MSVWGTPALKIAPATKPTLDDCLRAVESMLINGSTDAYQVSRNLGYRPARAGMFGVNSMLRALRRRELIGDIPPRDRWSTRYWFLTKAGEQRLIQLHKAEHEQVVRDHL